MSDIDDIRRDLARVGTDVAKGLSATTVLIESQGKQVSEIGRQLAEKTKEDHQADLARTAQLAELRTKVDGLLDLPERLARLEADSDRLKEDITGKHDLAKAVVERDDKKEDRSLAEKKIVADQRRETLRFWGAILALALPGLISLLWNLFGLPGSPPSRSSTPRAEHSAEHAEP